MSEMQEARNCQQICTNKTNTTREDINGSPSPKIDKPLKAFNTQDYKRFVSKRYTKYMLFLHNLEFVNHRNIALVVFILN